MSIVPSQQQSSSLGKEYVIVQSYQMVYNSDRNNPDGSVDFQGSCKKYNVKHNKVILSEQKSVSGRLKPENLSSVIDTELLSFPKWNRKQLS